MSFQIPQPESITLPIQGSDNGFPVNHVYCVGRNYAAHAREMGVDDKVATFTSSDFGRTIGNNGDGTDHAWSTINLVMSKSSGTTFNGGKFYGDLPNFTVGGDDDVKNGGKGRFVPKLSVEQMNATLCSWFGVPDNDMETLFPNLSNFKSGTDINSAYLKLSNTKLI